MSDVVECVNSCGEIGEVWKIDWVIWLSVYSSWQAIEWRGMKSRWPQMRAVEEDGIEKVWLNLLWIWRLMGLIELMRLIRLVSWGRSNWWWAWMILFRVSWFVCENEFCPMEMDDSWGRSLTQEDWKKLIKLSEVVYLNEPFPVVNVFNWGRSNELNELNETGQIQRIGFLEWILSRGEWSQFWKIEWFEWIEWNWSKWSMSHYRRRRILMWSWSIWEDRLR